MELSFLVILSSITFYKGTYHVSGIVLGTVEYVLALINDLAGEVKICL